LFKFYLPSLTFQRTEKRIEIIGKPQTMNDYFSIIFQFFLRNRKWKENRKNLKYKFRDLQKKDRLFDELELLSKKN
jgi:hypothetical protein